MFASLAGSGCALREIAAQVGLTHEAVRQRLRRGVAVGATTRLL